MLEEMPTTRAMSMSNANSSAEAENETSDPAITNLNRHVTVIIGDTKAQMSIPESMICFHSDFFKTACNERWESGRQKLVNLEEEDPASFSIFVSWMYTHSIYGPDSLQAIDVEDVAVPDTDKDKSLNTQWNILARCFILGQYLQAPGFQNGVCDALVRNSKDYRELSMRVAGGARNQVTYIWSNTPPGSPLRKLLLQNYAAGISIKTPLGKGHIQEFYEDLAEYTLLGLRNPKDNTYRMRSWERHACTFHTHPGAKERYSCEKKD